MTSIAAMPPSTTWYNPGWPSLPDLTDINVNSPQAPENPTLDKVQLTVTALYSGRVASSTSLGSLEQRENVRLQHLHNSGMMTSAALSAAGKTALLSGGFSLLRNMASMAQGEINVARATGNVTADIASGTIGGLAAGAAGGMVVQGTSNAGRALAGGLGTVVGAVAFAGANYLLDATGIKDMISDKITSILEGVDDSALPFDIAQHGGVSPAYNPYGN